MLNFFKRQTTPKTPVVDRQTSAIDAFDTLMKIIPKEVLRSTKLLTTYSTESKEGSETTRKNFSNEIASRFIKLIASEIQGENDTHGNPLSGIQGVQKWASEIANQIGADISLFKYGNPQHSERPYDFLAKAIQDDPSVTQAFDLWQKHYLYNGALILKPSQSLNAEPKETLIKVILAAITKRGDIGNGAITYLEIEDEMSSNSSLHLLEV